MDISSYAALVQVGFAGQASIDALKSVLQSQQQIAALLTQISSGGSVSDTLGTLLNTSA